MLHKLSKLFYGMSVVAHVLLQRRQCIHEFLKLSLVDMFSSECCAFACCDLFASASLSCSSSLSRS